MRDSSLDEFFGSDPGGDDPGGDDPGGDDPGGDDPDGDGGTSTDDGGAAARFDDAEGVPVAVASVDPAVATSRWDESGTTCRACGASVTRRWHAPEADAYVCRDCKDW
jgi:hypothetical protein